MKGPVVVIAPHPDDEILGVGGTMARLIKAGREVCVVIVTKGTADLFDMKLIEQGRTEAAAAHHLLGVARTQYLDFPAAKLDQVPHHELNKALLDSLKEIDPEVVFVPFRNDLHKDHRLVFDSAMFATRPSQALHVKDIAAYETLSETNWNAPHVVPGFTPTTFYDISETVDLKMKALAAYGSQLKQFPHERSIQAAQNLAAYRGSAIGVAAAEAFQSIRRVI